MTGPEAACLHASCVAQDGRGLLILGASGSGKSALALELMAYGAMLVADDRVIVSSKQGQLTAEPPEALRGMIEARGVGLLKATPVAPVSIHAAVDLDVEEDQRLPKPHKITILGQSLPLFRRVKSPHYAVALMQYLKAGRQIIP